MRGTFLSSVATASNSRKRADSESIVALASSSDGSESLSSGTGQRLQTLAVETFNACTEYLDERPVSGRTAALPTSAPYHAHSARRRIVGDFLGEPSLADTRLTTKQKHSAVASADFVQTGAELRQLALPADKSVVRRRLAIECALRIHTSGPAVQF